MISFFTQNKCDLVVWCGMHFKKRIVNLSWEKHFFIVTVYYTFLLYDFFIAEIYDGYGYATTQFNEFEIFDLSFLEFNSVANFNVHKNNSFILFDIFH